MRKIVALAIMFFVAIINLHAQTKVSGRVVDAENGTPLEGASVLLSGTKSGTTTNAAGEFTINAGSSARALIVSYSGYESVTHTLAGQSEGITISLTKRGALSDVIVTGSRTAGRTRLESPVPVDVIPVSRITNEVGQVDVNQILNYVAPSFQSARQTVADGTDHVDPAQLRGLGTDQILVLLNGKRRHQSALVNVNGTVNRGQVGTDLAAIPATAVERIEVLRDGAAAQYGSDAIAGVINIVLKKDTKHFNGNVSYGANVTAYPKDFALYKTTGKGNSGETSVTDGQTLTAGINYGIPLNTKGFINLTGEFLDRKNTNRGGTYTGAVYPNVNGVNRDDSLMAAYGTNRNTFDMRIGQSDMRSLAFFANSNYDLSDKWKLIVFGGYSHKNGEAAGFYRYPSGMPGAAGIYRTQAVAMYPQGFLPLIQTAIADFSYSAGLEGNLGKWSAALSNTYGKNVFDYTIDHSVNYTQFFATATPQTKFDAGGIRYSQNTTNLDVDRKFDVLHGLNVAAGAEFRLEQYEQQAGEEASYKNYNTASGAAAGAQVFAGFTPAFANKHSRTNFGIYSDNELEINEALLVSGALRFENYSDFGSQLNYKVAARMKAGKYFTFRGAVSTGFRAPSMQQKYYAKTNTLFISTPAGLVPTESGTFPNGSNVANILGIPALTKETSNNYSLGVTAKAGRLEVSVDVYQVDIKNRIVLTNNFTGGTDTTLTNLLKAAGATTANVFTNAIDTKNQGLEVVVNYSVPMTGKNSLRLTAAATFIKNEVKKGADGKPVIHSSQLLVNSGQLGSYFNREDQSRIEVANPQSKGNLMAVFQHDKFRAMARIAYFGKVQYWDPTINPANTAAFPMNLFTNNKETLDQTFSAKTVTDVSLGYTFIKGVTLTVGANNLFDAYQDMHTHSGNMSLGRFMYSRRVQQMGFNGRYIFGRLAFNF